MIHTIDEEIELSGVTYWLRAELRTTVIEDMTGDMESRWPTYTTSRPEIDDMALYGWSAQDQGYEVVVTDPRLLAAASAYAVENGPGY